MRLSLDRAAEIVATYEAAGSVRAAASAYGCGKSYFHKLLTAARAAEHTPDGYHAARVSTTLDKAGEVKATSVVAKRGPGEAHVVPEGHGVKRVSALLDPDGRVIQKWVISAAGADALDDAIATVRAELADAERLAPIAAPAHTDDDLLTVYPVVDQHHGLYAWAPEAGEDFDLATSEALLKSQLRQLVALAPPARRAQILGLGDFLHADTQDAKTPASGHFLDRDGRQSKVIRSGFGLLRWAIDLALSKHESVSVTIRAGNHDPMAAIYLSHMIDVAYENEPRVSVDLDPSLFWFATFGRVLLAATHGHTVKPADFAAVMAAECGTAWGDTEHRHGFQGHIHHETLIERGGAIVETFQTIAAKDAWHASKGYSSGRSMTALTFHRELGRVGRVWAPVLRRRERARVIEL